MDQALNSQKTPHTSPLRASYGMSFVSILMKNDRVIKGFYCIKPIGQMSDESWKFLMYTVLALVNFYPYPSGLLHMTVPVLVE